MLFTVTLNKEKKKCAEYSHNPCLQTLFGYLASQLADNNGFVVVVVVVKLLLLYVNIYDQNDKRKQGSRIWKNE